MKDKNYWKRWLTSALVRAIKTAAQTAVSLIGTGAVGFTELNWAQIFSVAGVTAVASILTSLVGLPEVKVEEENAEEDLK